jgi:hypothetical protein
VKEAAKLLNEMVAAKVVSNYALFGALAQMRYTSAVATLDADVLVAIPDGDRRDILAPIYRFCEARGYPPEGEAIRVGDWPVQFVPAFDALTTEAIEQAATDDVEGEPIRVATALHLVLLALRVGRGKDYARILALLEADAVTREDIETAAARHGLSVEWRRFRERFDAA